MQAMAKFALAECGPGRGNREYRWAMSYPDLAYLGDGDVLARYREADTAALAALFSDGVGRHVRTRPGVWRRVPVSAAVHDRRRSD